MRPAFGAGVRTDWLLGLGRADKRFILLLDTDRVLSEDEIATVQAAGDSVREAARAAA